MRCDYASSSLRYYVLGDSCRYSLFLLLPGLGLGTRRDEAVPCLVDAEPLGSERCLDCGRLKELLGFAIAEGFQPEAQALTRVLNATSVEPTLNTKS